MSRILPGFFIGGFESSTMRRRDGRRNDLASATRHDTFADADYLRLRDLGITTVREGAAWHRLEPHRGIFVADSVLGRVRAAERLGIQVIWDLCHFGWPDHVDPWSGDFADRLGTFAGWFARLLRDESSSIPWYVPVNEPSFVAWAGGDVGYLNPFGTGRGPELKRQLVRASVAAAAEVRAVDPRARICHVDPIIHIEPDPSSAESAVATIAHNAGQWEAWDMLAGRRDDDLGGSEAELDVIGVNFYDRNQWIDGGPKFRIGDPAFRPLRHMLAAVHERYRRPILIAETGAEGDARVPWLRYVADEVAAARRAGVEIEGICLYPVVDYPGWDDDRHVPVGLWGYADDAGRRPPYGPLVEELTRQAQRFDGTPPTLAPTRAAPVERPAPQPAPRASSAVPMGHGRTMAIVLATDSRAPSGMGRQMLTLASGLADHYRVVLSAPDAVDGRWLLDAGEAAGLEVWRLPDASPTAQAAAFASRLAGEEIDLVNIHAGIGWEGHLAVEAAWKSGVASIVRTEHLPFLLTKASEQTQYRTAVARVDRVIAVSRGVADSYAAAGVSGAKLRTVRNGIDEPRPLAEPAETRRRLGIGPDAPLLASVGRITSQKGHEILVAAAAAVLRQRPDARFVIVGSGPLAATIDARRRELGVEDQVLRLPGWTDVPGLLRASDVVLFASRFEGLPLVALEAMACERPVVGTSVCGLDEAVADSVTGRLVPADDAIGLSTAILDLLEDRLAATRYGRAGRARYEELFTAERMIADTEAVFSELLQGSPSVRSGAMAGTADGVAAAIP
jgi:glycosyltransferase involved in cell wall biosynthesis